MAYDPPTVGLLKGRFPEFGDVPDSLVQMVLDETVMFVDAKWLESDYLTARIHLAAHILQQNGAISAAQSGEGVDPAIEIDISKVSSISVGDTSISLRQDSLSSSAKGASMLSDEGLSNTPYGRMFLAIRKRNIPEVAVAASPSLPATHPFNPYRW